MSSLESIGAASARRSRRRMLRAGLALCVPCAALAQPMPTPVPMTPLLSLAESPAVSLPFTHQLDVEAAGRPRRLFIALPEGPLPQDSPVLWALDGNVMFPLLAALVRQRAARPPDQRVPQPVVVGIGHPGDAAYDMQARAEDYTPPGMAGGQADRFLDLLEQMQPWLARQLSIGAACHTLLGHSYGGLLALYALFSRPALFQRYVAAGPSIWWGDRAVLAHRDAFLRRSPVAVARRLLVTSGSLEEDMPRAHPERQQRQRERRQIGAARELVASLAGARGLSAEFRLIDGADHGSLMLPSAALALDFAVQAPAP